MRAPTPVILSSICSKWCINALSRMTTEEGFDPLKGCKMGKKAPHKIFKHIPIYTTFNYVCILNSSCSHYSNSTNSFSTNSLGVSNWSQTSKSIVICLDRVPPIRACFIQPYQHVRIKLRYFCNELSSPLLLLWIAMVLTFF